MIDGFDTHPREPGGPAGRRVNRFSLGPGLNSREIDGDYDNIEFAPLAMAARHAVPEPAAWLLLLLTTGFAPRDGQFAGRWPDRSDNRRIRRIRLIDRPLRLLPILWRLPDCLGGTSIGAPAARRRQLPVLRGLRRKCGLGS